MLPNLKNKCYDDFISDKRGEDEMRYNSRRFAFQPYTLFMLAFLLVIMVSWQGVQADEDWFVKAKEGHPKIESGLFDLQKNYIFLGRDIAHSLAQQNALRFDVQDRVTVFIHPKTEGVNGTIDEEALKAYGVEIIKKGKSLIKAKIPVYLLVDIADHVKGIGFIRQPDLPYIGVVSEGVNLSGGSFYHASGFRGQNVKVAVIDLGFAGLSGSILAGVLPPTVIKIDCTGSGCTPTDFSFEEENHGTAVAEIAHAMAPDAQLYLIKVGDSLDLRDAKDYCIANGIRIVNHSVGWFVSNFYDGHCYFDNAVCTADHAYRNGILWVNSAGNHARKHYGAAFIDREGDRLHNVTEESNFISLFAYQGDPIIALLTWDAWPVTDQDFDLLLYNSMFEVVASSTSIQSGTQPPRETLYYLAPFSGTYYLAIKKARGHSNPRFSLFTFYHELNPFVASGSLLSPSDARGVMAVAAIHYTQWETGPQESFSSQGPTTDGRVKPEISGPDGVSSFTFGTFYGTSASSPHVAGAAALILSNHSIITVDQLWNALTASAVDLGESGQDTIYGFGRLNLSTLSVDPVSIDFGEVLRGSSIERVLTVRNLGNQSLMIGAIIPPPAPFGFASDQCSGKFLPLGGSCTLAIRFSPSLTGLFESGLVIPSNDSLRGSVSVPLKGQGVLWITLLSPEDQTRIELCSINTPPLLQWKSRDPFTGYEIQFSGSSDFGSIPIKASVSGQTMAYRPFSFQWGRILSIPGGVGGTVYWRVVGKKSDGSFVTSEARSFLVPAPTAVGAPTIAPVSRAALPTLAWQNRCNVRFKVWFGSNPGFSTNRTLSFNLNDPDQKAGLFSKELASHQWLGIRRLVGDRDGSIIYWYVESWDGIKRKAITEVMSFILSD